MGAVAFTYHVLVVANRPADSPELLVALRARAESDSVSFTLLVPARRVGPQGRVEANQTMAAAVERAFVEGHSFIVGRPRTTDALRAGAVRLELAVSGRKRSAKGPQRTATGANVNRARRTAR